MVKNRMKRRVRVGFLYISIPYYRKIQINRIILNKSTVSIVRRRAHEQYLPCL